MQLAEPENEFLRSLEKLQRTRKDPLGSVEGRTGARSAGRAESEGGEGGEEGVSVEGGTASIAARRPTRRAAASAKTALAAARDGARTEPASPDISGAEGGAIKVRMGGVVGAAWGRPRHPHTGRTPPPPTPPFPASASAQEQAQRIMSENPGAYFQNLLSRDTKRTTRSKVRCQRGGRAGGGWHCVGCARGLRRGERSLRRRATQARGGRRTQAKARDTKK